MKRKKFDWQCRNKTLRLGEKTLIMGILNSTPDSFSDGGIYNALEKAITHCHEMINDGADIIDIGGESTRPGAPKVTLKEELKRTIPLISELRKQTEVAISIDTTKSEVARQALLAGANIINDVSGFQQDAQMKKVALELEAGCALMHMRGTSADMQSQCNYENLLDDVKSELLSFCEETLNYGIKKESILIDPGIGFSKTVDQNIELMKNLNQFCELDYPVLLGTSRKSFIGKILQEDDTSKRIWGTAASLCVGISHGIHVARVHDVKEMAQVCRVFDVCS